MLKGIREKVIELKVCPVCENNSVEEYITSQGTYMSCKCCTFEYVNKK